MLIYYFAEHDFFTFLLHLKYKKNKEKLKRYSARHTVIVLKYYSSPFDKCSTKGLVKSWDH